MRTFQDKVVPNLLRHFFPSYRLPRLGFSEGNLPARVPAATWCVDSTLGLGLPALGRLTSEQIVAHVEQINTLNRKSGLLRKAELVVEGEVERAALEDLVPRFKTGELQVEPVALILPTPSAAEPLDGLSLHEVGIQFGASDYLCVGEGVGSRREPVERLLETIDACVELGLGIRLDLLDITRADIDEFVIPLVADCMDHLAVKGDTLRRIRLVDSLGLGLPWAEAPVPRSIPRMVHTLTHHLSVTEDQLEFLGYNDMGLALANSVSAMMHGCAGIVTSLAGCGERAGLTPTELMLVQVCGLYGVDLPLHAANEGLELLQKAGGELAGRHPLFGAKALTRSFPPHEGSLAVTYGLDQPFDTHRLLKRPATVEMPAGAGAPGIIHLIHRTFPQAELACDAPAILELLAWVEEQEMNPITWPAIEGKVLELMPELF